MVVLLLVLVLLIFLIGISLYFNHRSSLEEVVDYILVVEEKAFRDKNLMEKLQILVEE
jgi:hypothetical protein